jgi:hypothetical protein
VLFPSGSLEFKLALSIALTFPYFALAVYTRDWQLWEEKIFQSLSAILLFCLSFVLVLLLMADYSSLKHWSLMELLRHSMFITLLYFPALALLIIVCLVSTAFKLPFPYNLLLGLLTHVLFLVNIALVVAFA